MPQSRYSDIASEFALTLGLGAVCYAAGMLTVLAGVQNVVPRNSSLLTTTTVEALAELVSHYSSMMNAVVAIGGVLLLAGAVAARWDEVRGRIMEAGEDG